MLAHRLADDDLQEHNPVKAVPAALLQLSLLNASDFFGRLDKLPCVEQSLSDQKVDLLRFFIMVPFSEQKRIVDQRYRASPSGHSHSGPHRDLQQELLALFRRSFHDNLELGRSPADQRANDRLVKVVFTAHHIQAS